MNQVERCDDNGSIPTGWRRAARRDVGRLAKAERTPAGGVRIPGAVARAGVLTYQCTDGSTVRELVPLEELTASCATLRDAPVTIGHPAPDAKGSSRVTPETHRELAVGHVSGEASVDEGHQVADLVVLDAAAIARIDAGELLELSPGYVCWIDPTPGVFEGQPYDQVQRHREYNHVALLPEGGARGGSTVALRVDGESIDFGVQVRAADTPSRTERVDSMEHEVIDGVTYKVGSSEWREALSKRRARIDEEMAKLEEAKTSAEDAKTKADADLEAMKAERDAMKAQLAELEAKLAEMESPEAVDARADARARLVSVARQALGADFKPVRTDGKTMTDREVRRAVLAKVAPDVDLAKVTEAYESARFDAQALLLAQLPSPALNSARADAFTPPSSSPSAGENKHTVGRTPPRFG